MMSFTFFLFLYLGIPLSLLIIVDVISLHSYNKEKKQHPERYRYTGRGSIWGGTGFEWAAANTNEGATYRMLEQIDWDIKEGNRQRQMEEIRKKFHLGG
jgi:hypothetical protein